MGDQVLTLLLPPNNPFQAKFTGPYSVANRLSDNNYLLNTPDCRRKVQICHIHLLKLYVAPITSASVGMVTTCDSFSSEQQSVVYPISCFNMGYSSPENTDEGEDLLSWEKVDGRLQNFEILADLPCHLSYLAEKERNDIELVM